MNNTLLMLLTPIIAPAIVELVKYITDKAPKWCLPLIAGLAGGLVEVINGIATGDAVTGWQGVALGLSGVGVRELVTQLNKARSGSGTNMLLLAMVLLIMPGCAHVKTKTECVEPDGSKRITEVSAWAVMDSKNELSKVKTTNTDKTQSVGWDGLEQSSSGTNVVSIAERISSAVTSAAIRSATGK